MHRVTFEVTDEQYKRLRKHLSYGYTKEVYNALTNNLLELLEQHGYKSVRAIADGKVKLNDSTLKQKMIT